MKRLLLVVAVSLALSARAGAMTASADLHLIVAKNDGTHVAASWPLSDDDLRDAASLWVWTSAAPPRKFARTELRSSLEELIASLEPSSARMLHVRARGIAREESPSAQVIVAPEAMWASVPEPLLPHFRFPKEGVVTIPVREPVRLRAIADDAGSAWAEVPPSATSVDILLRSPSADVALTLRLQDGKPVARAFAAAMHQERDRSRARFRAQFAADARGVITIPSLPASETISLLLTAEGAAPQVISGTADELTRTIRLHKGGSVTGAFIDEDEEPLEGVQVEAEGWIPASEFQARSDAKSDAKGAWTVTRLPLGRVVVRASHEGHATFQSNVSLEEGNADLGVITLLRSIDIELEVTDSSDEPIAGAIVTSGTGFKARTGDTGIVRVTGIASDQPLALTVAAEGFADQTVHLTPPLAKREKVMLERAFSIRGRLLDQEGRPVTDATAQVTIATSYRRVDIDADGTFSIDVEPGREFELMLESPTSGSLTRNESSGRSGEMRDLGELRLVAGFPVTGRVVDSSGAPLSGARVWAVRSNEGGAVAAWVSGRIAQATSDADGAFRLRGLSEGPALLRVDTPDFARATRNVVVGSSAAEPLTIELERGSTVTVESHASDSAVARLDLRGDWLELDMVTAPLSGGRARLRNIPAGEYIVTVVEGRNVLCEQRVTVTAGADAEVGCGKPTRTSGRVTLDGAPASGGVLVWTRPNLTDGLIMNQRSSLGALRQSVYGAGRGHVVVSVGSDGMFETDELSPGEWQVVWQSTDGARTPERPITIPQGPAAQVNVEFQGSMLRGRVIDESQKPIAGARVREIQGPLSAIAAEDGSFALAAVAPGLHRLQASLGSRSSRIIDVSIESGHRPAELTLVIEEQERNILRVDSIGVNGEPQSGAIVFVEGLPGLIKTFTADAEGVATAGFPEGLLDGARIVVFARNSWAFGALRRSGGDDEVQRASVRFAPSGALEIRTRSISGSPELLASGSGDLTWMFSRVGFFLSVAPEAPLIIGGLPPGAYEVRLDGEVVSAVVKAGSTARVNLR